VLATVLATARLLRAIVRALADPATRGVVVLAGLTLASGTLFYARAEGWSLLDALYFSVVTLTTIGYGDLAVTSDGAKVFTIVYSLVGIGIIATFVASLAITTRSDTAGSDRPSETPGGGRGRSRRSRGRRGRP
jgi:voltage-gated potassium channel